MFTGGTTHARYFEKQSWVVLKGHPEEKTRSVWVCPKPLKSVGKRPLGSVLALDLEVPNKNGWAEMVINFHWGPLGGHHVGGDLCSPTSLEGFPLKL